MVNRRLNRNQQTKQINVLTLRTRGLRPRQHLSHNPEGETATDDLHFTLALFKHASERIGHFLALAGNRGGTVARD